MERNRKRNDNSVTIGGDPDDIHYRYWRDSAAVSTRRGRTVLTNLAQIAADLGRDEKLIAKFLSVDLGTKAKRLGTRDDRKSRPGAKRANKSKPGPMAVSGNFSASDIETWYVKFQQVFVVCPSCGIADTCLEARGKKAKRAVLTLYCAGCGYKSPIEGQGASRKSLGPITKLVFERAHKARSEKNSGGGGSKKTSGRRHPRAGGGARRQIQDQAQTDRKDEERKGTPTPLMPPTPESETEDDVEWFTDTSAAAREQRFLEEFGGGEGTRLYKEVQRHLLPPAGTSATPI